MGILFLFLVLAWVCLAIFSGAASAANLAVLMAQPSPKARTPARHGSMKRAVLWLVFACACMGAVMRGLGHL